MVKVTIGNNVKRESKLFNPNKTLRECLAEANVDFTRGTIHLDGATVEAGGLNKTLKEYGYDGSEGHNMCFLLNVVKADNA